MVSVKFLKDYTVKAENGATYKKGEVYEMSDAGASHFVNRQAAEIFVAEKKPKKKPKAKPKPKASDGERGGDAIARFSKAQREYREEKLSGDD